MTLEVPYDRKTGNLLHYPPYAPHLKGRSSDDDTEWRPNDPFDATIVISDYTRGRSATAYFLATSTSGIRYPMFLTDLHGLLMGAVVRYGTVKGRWDVVKRGQNYGLHFIKEMP